MGVLLTKVKWKFALAYLDDVIIFSCMPEEHTYHVQKVLKVLYDAGVTLKLKKCEFFTIRIDYPAHVIRPGHLEVSTRTIDAIRRLKYLPTVAEH